MKKNKGKKLTLSKNTVASLSNDQANDIQGGFTYSLSLGARCKQSKADQKYLKDHKIDYTRNPYECATSINA